MPHITCLLTGKVIAGMLLVQTGFPCRMLLVLAGRTFPPEGIAQYRKGWMIDRLPVTHRNPFIVPFVRGILAGAFARSLRPECRMRATALSIWL